MSQIPETGPIRTYLPVKISVATALFHPRQTRKGPQCAKYRIRPLRIPHEGKTMPVLVPCSRHLIVTETKNKKRIKENTFSKGYRLVETRHRGRRVMNPPSRCLC